MFSCGSDDEFSTMVLLERHARQASDDVAICTRPPQMGRLADP